MNRLERGEEVTGFLLIAHPAMRDSYFQRALVLVSAYSLEEGAIGVVWNTPIGRTLGEANLQLANSVLAEVPLYRGGPVNEDKLILIAWQWVEEKKAYQLVFGITFEKAEAMIREHPNAEIRGFLGHSGWTSGQLERELQQDTWIIAEITPAIFQQLEEDSMWRQCLITHKPEWAFLADVPNDPSLN